MAITEVRIHPSIGIARVGNSDSDFFIGPERRWDRAAPQGGYKDAQCRIKRQAARFRVFGYDNGVPVELTAANASIEWTVHLVNRKAVAPGFPSGSPRNSGYSGADRDKLIIDPGSRTLNGPDQRKEFNSGTFKVKNHAAKTVSLGEVRTDDDGRLLVLGGLGNSGSPSNHALGSFGDSDEWHDDVSDGPVTATVTIGAQTFTAAPSWVIVAPPKFAPPIDNVFRLWDMLFDVFVKDGQLQVPVTPSYVNDVYPILQAAADTSAVRSNAIGHHAFTHPMAGSPSLVNRLTATNSTHMPPLYSESLTLDLKLTDTQIAIMQKWSVGTVNNDWNGAWAQGPPPDANVTPDGMDKAALENCVGAALYPGIEAGQFLRDATKFLPVQLVNGVPSFRINHGQVSAGQVTQSMALPWQSDFLACDIDWWPVPRPNQVTVAGSGTKDWARSVANREEFVASKWNAMGFVTRQGGVLVETDRCDTADTWVSLVTPALTFDDVPQGPMGTIRKAARAIVFEIKSTVSVTLSFTAPANASLTRYTSSPYTQPPTGGAVATARLWIIYAPPNDSHSVTDSITVTCSETGQTWTIPITANSVPRKTAAAALVLDKSGSMSEDRGDGLGNKSQSVREAANTFVDVMLPGDALSLTAFDDNASVLTGLTTLGDPADPFDMSRSTLHGFINGPGLNPGGNTSIGDGIFEGRGTLSGATLQVQSLVVLTDGNENRTRWISDVADQINENTYSIGVGTASNTSAAALETISGNHGGCLLITGAALGGDNEFLLKKYFLQILAGVSNAEIVLDPIGMISTRQVQRIPFVVCDQDNLADVILLAQDRKYLQFLLETPDGQLVDPNTARAIGGQFIVTSQVSYYRIPLPLMVDPTRHSHSGTWNAVLAYGGRGGTGIAATHVEPSATATARQRYSIIVHTWSDVAFTAAAHQSGFTPGATVNLIARLSAAGIPFTANAHVQADITKPGGALSTVTLWPQGDEFLASFTTTLAGDYRIRVRATGQTDRGNPFTREKTLSAGVWRGGDTPPRGGPGDIGSVLDDNRRRWCAFLRCILSMLAKDEALLKRWRELGIDPREFIKCVELLCRDGDAARVVASPASDAVRRLIDELHRTVSSQ
jgi:L-Lysine epsilon oxidase N-terminal/L-lysine epsilon oxidase C-terminal domain/von Willebrand factor type A domain